MNDAQPIPIITGQPVTLAFQCYLRGSGTVPAVFNSTDELTSSIIQTRQTTALFSPTPAFYTAGDTQDGYQQGQVQASWTVAQGTLLIPTISYTLLIWRVLESDTADPDPIVRVRLVIEPLAI
jgi:hypothetical protein